MGSPAPAQNNSHEEITTDVNFRIPIVGFEVMNRAKFTVFKLRIENEKLGESWLVFRRYTDFVRLHAKLKEEFPSLNLPLPPKRWLRDNYEIGFLEDRMKMLQSFVDTILCQETTNLVHSPIVRDFFCLDEPPTNPESSSEESRSLFGNVEDNMVHLKQQLQQQLTEKDLECQLLKTELALVTTQRDSLLKTTKSCRQCSQRLSIITSSSPILEGRNHQHSPSSRNDNRNRNSSSSASSMTSNENSVTNSPKTSTPKTSIPEDSTQASSAVTQNESSQIESPQVESVLEADTSDTVNEIAVNGDS